MQLEKATSPVSRGGGFWILIFYPDATWDSVPTAGLPDSMAKFRLPSHCSW